MPDSTTPVLQYGAYVAAPFICALIGWLTNFVAVKMLFHPRRAVGWGPVRVQGVFPKRQAELAANLGRLVEQELVSHEDIQAALEDPRFAAHCREIVMAHLKAFLNNKLTSLSPMASMLMGDKMRQSVEKLLSEELESVMPELLHQAGRELERRVDFSKLVEDKVTAFSMDKLEEILFSIMRKEFRFIELVGAVLGFVIGAVQAGIFFAVG
jgi:uncharacterized membrane protein YheB (UPF0754 family)